MLCSPLGTEPEDEPDGDKVVEKAGALDEIEIFLVDGAFRSSALMVDGGDMGSRLQDVGEDVEQLDMAE